MIGKSCLYGLLLAAFFLMGCGLRAQSSQLPYIVLEDRPPDPIAGIKGIAVAVDGLRSVEELKALTCRVSNAAGGDEPTALSIRIYYDLTVNEYIPGAPGDGTVGEIRAAHWLAFYEWREEGFQNPGLGVVTGMSGQKFQPAEYHPFDHTGDCAPYQ
jgi:hypothetical protein